MRRNLFSSNSLRVAAFFSFGFLALFAQAAHAQDALNYTKNYYVTGDVVVGGVGGMRATGVNGYATRTFDFSGVPAGADIVAAFLYWETVETSAAPAAVNGFFGTGPTGSVPDATQPIVGAVRGNPNTTACWSSGGTGGNPSGAGRVYRADVLRYLRVDSVNNVRLANGSYTVKLPDYGNGGNGNITYTDGASLVVVYRVLTPENPLATPLRAVVIYDGAFTLTKFTPAMNQTIGGLYDALGGPTKMTHILANGQPGNRETLTVNGLTVAGGTNPFQGTAGNRWDDPTFTFNLDAHAASYSTQLTSNDNQICLTWAAIVTSTPVTDSDNDGLLDAWETNGFHLSPGDSTHPATFGGCSEYPTSCVNLPAMGALANHQDIFVEIDWLHGADAASGPDHLHRPKLDALNAVGSTFSLHNISLHFDVGNNYQGLGSPYIIPYNATVVKAGGEVIEESDLLCPNAHITAAYCAYTEPYAVVGWKIGFRALKDGFPVLGMPSHFARNRKDIFHYVLFAHALAGPFDAAGRPLSKDPKSVSGVADRPGGDLMLTLGLWRSDFPENDQVGSVLVQAGTLMHELGHNLGLSHAGLYRTPNCMPNYPSVMNYIYQTRGLTGTIDGRQHIDFSYGGLPSWNESSLSEQPFTAPAYRLRYYGPFRFSDPPDGAAKVHCDGTPITDGAQMIRLENNFADFIDWNHDGLSAGLTTFAQDVNFNGSPALSLDSDDWSHLNLRQVSARLNVSGLSADVHLGQTDLGQTDLGQTDLGQTDLGQTDLGQTDLGQTDLGQTDLGQTDLGQTDLGQTDLGQTDLGDEDYDTHSLSTVDPPPPQSLDCPTCGLTATRTLKDRITLHWTAPSTGSVNHYNIYRSDAAHPVPAFLNSVAGGAPTRNYDDMVNGTNTLNDTDYTYFVTTVVSIGGSTNESAPSNTAVGIAPLKIRLTVTAHGVNKVYDGTTTATVTLTDDRIPGDVFTVNYASANFSNKNVGTAKTVTVTGISISGPDAYKYLLVSTTATTTAVITPKHITGTFTADNKIYDGNTSATVLTRSLVGAISGDDVRLTGGTATFNNKNAANGKTVTLSGATLSGADAGNYILDSVATTTANILPKHITGTFTADNKIYDGNTSATVLTRSLVGTIAGDNIFLIGGTATFANKNAGTGKIVTLSGATLGGTDAGNYILDSVATTTANITPARVKTILSNTNGTYPVSSIGGAVALAAQVKNLDHSNALITTGSIEIKVFCSESETEACPAGFPIDVNAPGGPVVSSLDLDGAINGGVSGTATVAPNNLPLGGRRYVKAIFRPITAELGNFLIQPYDNTFIPDNTPDRPEATELDRLIAGCHNAAGTPVAPQNGECPAIYTAGGDFLNHQVTYAFTGFFSPLAPSGSFAGNFNVGKAIPVKYQLDDANGTFVNNLRTLKSLVAVYNPTPATGDCPIATTGQQSFLLYNPTAGATGGSTFRFGNSQYIFNWDTSYGGLGAGCYTLLLQLSDGTIKTNSLRLR